MSVDSLQKPVTLPTFANTPVESIPEIVARVRNTFFTHRTKPVAFRIAQLRSLYWAFTDHQDELLEACRLDLGKGQYEAMVGEVSWIQNDILFMQKNLEKWCKDESPDDISLSTKLMSPRIRKDPLGVVLVIGAFNFPFMLSLGPVIGAISGGNTVVLKPSEMSPNCAAVMQKIMAAGLDPDCYTCVNGGIPETTALLAEKWDKIFFTGSHNVGKIIAKAAAPTLTPVTLELGGRNPAIVTKRADIRLAARRLLWAKTLNAGQVCVSQNYILADREVVPTLVAELRTAMAEFFPRGAKNTTDFAHIVNLAQFKRIKAMLDNSTGKIVAGGAMDAEKLFIEPTVIEVSSASDSLITDESFGPLLPILPVTDLEEALRIANDVHSTPLGVYAFGSKDETDRILRETRSGGATVNDGFVHGVIPTLAFGGIGDSGSGAYRGKASFDCFVHRRSVARTPGWMESLLAVRYPPFEGTSKYGQYAKMSNLVPDFDRQGRDTLGMLRLLLTLGAGSLLGGACRAAILAALGLVMHARWRGQTWSALR